MLNLDTNVMLAVLGKATRRDETRVLQEDAHWSVSAIVLWELEMLFRDRRIRIGLDDPDLQSLLRQVDILPLSFDVARTSHRLDFSADPADEIIAATSIVYGAPLVTRDSRMVASRLVPLAVR